MKPPEQSVQRVIDLTPFFDPARRIEIRTPWYVATVDKTYATDARVIVELDGLHPAAVNDPAVKRPNVSPTMADFRNEPRAPLPVVPAYKGVECPNCGGVGTWACDCPNCETEHMCVPCHGSGQVETKQFVQIGAAKFDSDLMRRIGTLPNVKISTRGQFEPGCFTFDGGRGLVMPWRDSP